MYLYDDNHLNDIEYLLNKDVLFEKIPYMIAQSLTGDYDEGNSYNWAQWKSFNEDMILGLYIRKMNIEDMKPENCCQNKLDGNLALLCAEIEAHPETQFKISNSTIFHALVGQYLPERRNRKLPVQHGTGHGKASYL